jgi:hypothetical protein
MDHEFDLAFELLDTAADRLQMQQYGHTTIAFHNHGDDLTLTTVHTYTRSIGHKLTLLAHYTDTGELAAAVEATAPDLETEPQLRIIKVYAADLMFHAIAGTWSFRAKGHYTHTITAGVGEEPMWTLHITTSLGGQLTATDTIADLVDHILTAEAAHAA